MSFDPAKARVLQQLLQQGLSEDQALTQAGISERDLFFYTINDVAGDPNRGRVEPTALGPPARPNEVVVPPAAPPPRAETTISSTTTSQTTITGGGVTTTRVTPVQYTDTAQSRVLQSEADGLRNQRDARAAELRAQGLSGAEVLRDPEYRALGQQIQSTQNQASAARQRVPTPGQVEVTTTPGQTRTISETTQDGSLRTRTDTVAATDTVVETATLPPPAVTSFNQATPLTPVQLGPAPTVVPLDTRPRVGITGPVEGISPYGEQDDLLEPPQPTTQPGAQTTFDEFGNITYPVADDNLGFEQLPDDNLAFQQGVDPGPGYGVADDNLGFEQLPDDNLAFTQFPEPVLQTQFGNFSANFDPETQSFGVFDNQRGVFVRTGLTEQEAAVSAQQFSRGSADVAESGAAATDLARRESETKARLAQAQQQATIQQRFNQTTSGDWRVRLRLAPQADYLYRDPSNALLRPLAASDGVIFPYVPQIQTNYVANYDSYNLTHSNYRGYFYKSSNVGDIQITAKFTAQDTREAEYLLAVIHFFRSVTKMFYGKDALRGAPPPFVELSGYGQFQFNNHPCLVQQFNYNLPDGVDYIRINPNNQGINLTPRRNLSGSSPPTTISGIADRLKNAGLWPGAEPQTSTARSDIGLVNQTVSGTGQTTYVPTLLEIQLVLLPLQTRSQVSQLFSVKEFANGNLLRGGFW
jgi:hypothetical protein